jgi:hypothetical protein
LFFCFSIYIRTENQRDSASDEEDEDLEDGAQWLKQFDADRRTYYWQNFATNQITYDEPVDMLAHEKDLVGKRIKVFWVVQVHGDFNTLLLL